VEFNNGVLSESSDTSLRHNVVTTLYQTGYYQHRMLDIAVDHGTVTVEGHVPTWYLRQIALECVRRVTGVVQVVDRIRVVTEAQDDHARCFDGKR
jgi:osmotically-inducible protein OsmY